MHAHEEWDHPPKYCKACKEARDAEWYEKDCERCGTSVRARYDWSHPPKFCNPCKEKEAAEWTEISCADCGTAVRIRFDWDRPPHRCKSCTAKRATEWYEIKCGDCGTAMRARYDWAKPPKYCAGCKARRDAAWLDKSCEECRQPFRVRKDWVKPPRYCPDCKAKKDAEWYAVKCILCRGEVRAKREWDTPPKYCRECIDSAKPKKIACKQCGDYFEVSTKTQLKCLANKWELPRSCPQCKEDLLLIKAALGALRERYPFAIEATIEQQRSILTAGLFPQKVVVVRNRKTGEIVSRMTMENGIPFFAEERTAVAFDRGGKRLSETRDKIRGPLEQILDPGRVAETRDTRGNTTHESRARTTREIFPKPFVETARVKPSIFGNVPDGEKSTTSIKTTGIFRDKSIVTRKED